MKTRRAEVEKPYALPGHCALAGPPRVGHIRAMTRDAVSRLVRAWLVTAIVDALFSSALAVFAYRPTLSAADQILRSSQETVTR